MSDYDWRMKLDALWSSRHPDATVGLRDDLADHIESLEARLNAAEAVCENVLALRGERSHLIGCDCGGTDDGVHTCHTLNVALDAWEAAHPAAAAAQE